MNELTQENQKLLLVIKKTDKETLWGGKKAQQLKLNQLENCRHHEFGGIGLSVSAVRGDTKDPLQY